MVASRERGWLKSRFHHLTADDGDKRSSGNYENGRFAAICSNIWRSGIASGKSLNDYPVMKDQEYGSMARLEATFWWYRSLHDKVVSLLRKHLDESHPLDLLDVGCGTGGMLRQLERAFPTWQMSGLDISEKAVACSLRSNHAAIIMASANSLPYRNGAFDVLVSLDVMCHDLVCPERMLSECARVLKPGGVIVLNLPAYQWLHSYHDVQVQQSRRYTRKGLKAEIAHGPFECMFATYWNAALFLPLVIKRKVFPGRPTNSDVTDCYPLLNACFTRVMQLETKLVNHGYSLPFGSSVLYTGRRSDVRSLTHADHWSGPCRELARRYFF